jgi:hypothetical protein
MIQELKMILELEMAFITPQNVTNSATIHRGVIISATLPVLRVVLDCSALDLGTAKP